MVLPAFLWFPWESALVQCAGKPETALLAPSSFGLVVALPLGTCQLIEGSFQITYYLYLPLSANWYGHVGDLALSY
jgi:hypothetical protein